jgi:hypothetical protein
MKNIKQIKSVSYDLHNGQIVCKEEYIDGIVTGDVDPYTVQEYDCLGRLINNVSVNSIKKSKEIKVYDSKNNVIKSFEEGDFFDEYRSKVVDNIYNFNNSLQKKIVSQTNGKVIEQTDYIYDESQNVIKKIKENFVNSTISIYNIINTYDDKNRLIKVVEREENIFYGEPFTKEFIYGESTKTIKTTFGDSRLHTDLKIYDLKDKLLKHIDTNTYEFGGYKIYYYDGDNLLSEHHFDYEQEQYDIITIDDCNIEEIQGTIMKSYFYVYRNNHISEISTYFHYFKQQPAFSIEYITYEFDENKAMRKKTTSVSTFNANSVKRKVENVKIYNEDENITEERTDSSLTKYTYTYF